MRELIWVGSSLDDYIERVRARLRLAEEIDAERVRAAQESEEEKGDD